jgi:hypothetical protein
MLPNYSFIFFGCLMTLSQLKVKVKLSVCLNKQHAMKTYLLIKHHTVKTYGGRGSVAPRILNLEMEASSRLHALAALPPGKEPLVSIVETGWDPESVWIHWQGEKSHHCSCREVNPGRPSYILTELPQLVDKNQFCNFALSLGLLIPVNCKHV